MDNNLFHHPWLSVIVPVYNAEKYLNACLNSILNQSDTDFEVILVDDGSTDGSSGLCLQYQARDSRIRYFRKENGGAFQTRIYGAEQAQGTYIAFCDSDDFYATKDAFRILHQELNCSPVSMMQFGLQKKYNHLRRNKSTVSEPLNVTKSTFLCQEYPKLLCSFWDASHLTTSTCTKVYHRSLLQNLPPHTHAERIFWGDDQVLNMYLLETCESVRFIPNILYCYRQFSGGTSKFSPHAMEDLDRIKKYQLYFLERYSGPSAGDIQAILFSEIAGWFFYYVQQALENLSVEEVSVLINRCLALPSFQLAKQYYLEHPENQSEAVMLLRNADAAFYIERSTLCRRKRSLKHRIIDTLKKIYVSI